MEIVRLFDIDLDVVDAHKVQEYGVRAMLYNETLAKVMPHPSGIYLEDVPVDEATGLCAFDYEYGNETGFAKLDILSNSAYKIFKDKKDLIKHVNMKPDWEKFLDPKYHTQLPHIANYGEIIGLVKPQSIEEVADITALIRPAKIKYLNVYLQSKHRARRNLYKRPADGGMYFKRAHAISYAVMIVAVFNKILSKETRSDLFL